MIIGIIFCIATMLMLYTAWKCNKINKELHKKIVMINAVFAYCEWCFLRDKKKKENDHKGKQQQFLTGRISAMCDVLKRCDMVLKMWDRPEQE